MVNIVYKQNKEVIFRQEQDEAILFNPDNSEIVIINSTGCFIWGLCNSKNTKTEIVTRMIQEYQVTVKTAEKDIKKYLSDLESKGFIGRA
ncbi:MAG: PqqD family protein [Candidatus Omnitrophota bacterium]|nr:PqqD family protein [Candidatus Omnitrophota bacterium]